MKRKFLPLVLMLMFSHSAAVYALGNNNGKLLDHKEYLKGDIKATFNEITNTAMLPAFIQQSIKDEDNTDHTVVFDNLNSVTGAMGRETMLSGVAIAIIENHTNITQTYSVYTNVCISSSLRQYDCAESVDKITVNPSNMTWLVRVPTIVKKFQREGTYKPFMITQVKQEESNYAVLSGSEAVITIYEPIPKI